MRGWRCGTTASPSRSCSGRRAIPSALYGTFFSPEVWKDAEYLVVVGPKPSPAPGRLLFETPRGSVWLRDR
jgi:hypothetical protein